MSLVRKPGGTFILLDSHEPDKTDMDELMALSDGGSLIDAVLNVHPFHTVHCDFIQEKLPHARLIGTRRHHRKMPHLAWDSALIEDAATQQEFSEILDFSIPAGVDFISDDETVHVSSVIVRHRASGIVHVDDTLMFLDVPSLLQKVAPGPDLRFHPKLSEGLEKCEGAADDYRRWAAILAHDWRDTKIVCAAHNGILRLTDQTFPEAIENALEYASETLEEHIRSFGRTRAWRRKVN
jgi:hypothetical protein